jgi:hypothetical protein
VTPRRRRERLARRRSANQDHMFWLLVLLGVVAIAMLVLGIIVSQT